MLGRALGGVSMSERRALIAAVVLGWAVRLLYVVTTRGHRLAGDENIYYSSAVLQEQGHWFWSRAVYGIPHESFHKAPIYQTWVGLWFEVLGVSADRVFVIQAVLLAPLVIGLTFLLARRLFGSRAAIGAAFVMAVYPFAWQWEVRMFSESIALPLTLFVLLLVLTVPPSRRVVIGVGVLLGILMLTRPTSFFLVPAMAVAWVAAMSWRRGLLATGAAVCIATLVVAPWTIRNRSVDPDHFVPISTQDVAAYGTFSDEAANDDVYPWKWRPVTRRDADVFDRSRPLSDGEFRAVLRRRIIDFVEEHPDAVPKAFFYNGVLRLWDFDPPWQTVDEADFNGTSRSLTLLGLIAYWVMLPFALFGAVVLWRRGRRSVVLAVAAAALAASVIYTADGATRYRAPFEPVIVTLACGGAAELRSRRRQSSLTT